MSYKSYYKQLVSRKVLEDLIYIVVGQPNKYNSLCFISDLQIINVILADYCTIFTRGKLPGRESTHI